MVNINVKKIISILLMCVITVTLSSCSAKEKNTVNEKTKVEEKADEKVNENVIIQEDIVQEDIQEVTERMYTFLRYSETNNYVNVRTSFDSNIANIYVTYLPETFLYLAGETSNGWYIIYVDNQKMYISKEYVTLTSVIKYQKDTLETIEVIGENESEYLLADKKQTVAKDDLLNSYPVEEVIVENTEDIEQLPEIVENQEEEQAEETLMSMCTTYFSYGTDGRVNNLTLAANSLNGVIINPSEEFIWSQIVGETTYDKGYQDANVYVGDEVQVGLGGGVCQVSSTLYGAVLDAGLAVTERHAHSMPVSYAEAGRDATIWDGVLDFRFLNNTLDQIVIYSEVGDGYITIYLYSR